MMAESAAVRVLVGEDQPLVREGIVRVLEVNGFQVVATAGNAPDLVRKAAVHRPDVVVTDIQMPPDSTDDGLRAALEIRTADPDIGVLVLSQFLEDRYAFDLVAGGAGGVGSALDPDVVERLIGRSRRKGPLDRLTSRERQVLALIAQGRSNSGVAADLVVTVAAVERHVTSIFDKLGLHQAPDQHRRVLAVLSYLKS
jgi:DNA-binding NarL/FixJ family response regulator